MLQNFFLQQSHISLSVPEPVLHKASDDLILERPTTGSTLSGQLT